MLLPKVYNMFIPKMPLHSIFHQLFLGGILKIFFTLLMINYNEYNLPNEKNTELISKIHTNDYAISDSNQGSAMFITGRSDFRSAGTVFFRSSDVDAGALGLARHSYHDQRTVVS